MDDYNKDLDAMKSNMEKAKKGLDAAENMQEAFEKDGLQGAAGALGDALDDEEVGPDGKKKKKVHTGKLGQLQGGIDGLNKGLDGVDKIGEMGEKISEQL